MTEGCCADPECQYVDQPHTHERSRPVIDPDGRTVHIVPASLGQRVRSERTALGMTQASLAEAVGVTVPYVSKVENGHETPSEPCIARFAAALDLDPVELLLASGRVPALIADRLDRLLAITRDLAAVDPTGFDPDCCTLCRRVIVPAGAPHSEDCPWVRARAFCTPPPATPEETE